MVDYLEVDYAEELRWLCQEIVKKRRGKLTCILLLPDNAPAHTSQVAMAAATKCSFKVLHHTPVFSRLSLFGLLSVSKSEN